MANYYDWNPHDDKPKDKQPAVEPNNQPEPSPIPPPEQESPAVPLEALTAEADTNPWATEEYISAPPGLLDDLGMEDAAASEPIEADDELHPMYRVVSAMLETDDTVPAVEEQSQPPAVDLTVQDFVDADAVQSAAPTETLTDALLADTDLPPIPSRIDELTQAIERYPQSPVNYVLRGEANWDAGYGTDALRDFLAALRLAESRDTTWEFLNRSILDRARQGLRRCGYQNTSEY